MRFATPQQLAQILFLFTAPFEWICLILKVTGIVNFRGMYCIITCFILALSPALKHDIACHVLMYSSYFIWGLPTVGKLEEI